MGVSFKKWNCSGFTLIESVVVISILVIMAAIAIPGFSAWMPEARLKRAARDLYSNIQLAKMQSARTNQNHTLVFNVGGGTYELQDSGGGVVKTITFSDYGSSVGYGHGNAGAAVGGGFDNDVTYPGDNATFQPRGNGESGYVYLTNSRNGAYAVGTGPQGYAVRLWKWDGAQWE